MVLSGIGEDDEQIVVAAAGNRRGKESDEGRFPGIHKGVVMVSAVDSQLRRPSYSCCTVPGPLAPALHVAAPGGGDKVPGGGRECAVKVAGVEFVGTSVATAYAAGVIARSIASGARYRDAKELRSALQAAATPIAGWDDDSQHCKGLIKQLN